MIETLHQFRWISNPSNLLDALQRYFPERNAVKWYDNKPYIVTRDPTGAYPVGLLCGRWLSLREWVALLEGVIERSVLSMLYNAHPTEANLESMANWPTATKPSFDGTIFGNDIESYAPNVLESSAVRTRGTIGTVKGLFRFNYGGQNMPIGVDYATIYPPIQELGLWTGDTWTRGSHTAGNGGLVPELNPANNEDIDVFVERVCDYSTGVGLSYYPPNKVSSFITADGEAGTGYQWQFATSFWQKFSVPEDDNPLGNPFLRASGKNTPTECLVKASFGADYDTALTTHPSMMSFLASVMDGSYSPSVAPMRMLGVWWAAINSAVSRMAISTPYRFAPGEYMTPTGSSTRVWRGVGWTKQSISKDIKVRVSYDNTNHDWVLVDFSGGTDTPVDWVTNNKVSNPIYSFQTYPEGCFNLLAQYKCVNNDEISNIISAYYYVKNGGTLTNFQPYYAMFEAEPRPDGLVGVARCAVMTPQTILDAINALIADGYDHGTVTPPSGSVTPITPWLSDIITSIGGFGIENAGMTATWSTPDDGQSNCFNMGFPCNAAVNAGYVSNEYLHVLYGMNMNIAAPVVPWMPSGQTFSGSFYGAHGGSVSAPYSTTKKMDVFNGLWGSDSSTTAADAVHNRMISLLTAKNNTGRSIVLTRADIRQYINSKFVRNSQAALACVQNIWADMVAEGAKPMYDEMAFWVDPNTTWQGTFADGLYYNKAIGTTLGEWEAVENVNDPQGGLGTPLWRYGGRMDLEDLVEAFNLDSEHPTNWSVTFPNIDIIGAVDWGWQALHLINL